MTPATPRDTQAGAKRSLVILSDNDDYNSLLQSLWPWLLAFSFQHWLVPSCCRFLFFRLTPVKQQFIWVFKMGGRARYLFIFVLV